MSAVLFSTVCVTDPTGTFLERESATLLALPGTYLKVGLNSCIVKSQRASLPERFLP